MTKKELEHIIKMVQKELKTAIDDSYQAAKEYSIEGEHNYAFQTGYLNGRINIALTILNEVK